MNARLDLRVCRRLAQLSCTYDGSTPPSALASVQAAGSSLGQVLVIDVGYNEGASTYRDGMRQLIRTALAHGVKGIVWVTLRETRDIYAWTNTAIRAEARRWPEVRVADWNRFSHGHDWFGGDGLHLNPAGAEGLAELLRPLVLAAAKGSPCADSSPASSTPALPCTT